MLDLESFYSFNSLESEVGKHGYKQIDPDNKSADRI